MRFHPAFISAALPFLACCPSSSKTPKPDNFPSADAFVAQLNAKQEAAGSFKALDNRMDWRVGGERVKTNVHVMGERGAKIRLNALNPDETTAADLACDGISFNFVDYNANCQLTGPCTGEAISQLLRVNLEPDDFLALAIGSAPLLVSATASVEWDSSNGTAVLKLLANDNSQNQELILDGSAAGKEPTWNVLGATMRDATGEVDWTLENKEFSVTKDGSGKEFRVPGRTRFQQPKDEGDLKVRWQDRELNIELPAAAFQMTPPEGLLECGQKATPPPGTTTPNPAPSAANSSPSPTPSTSPRTALVGPQRPKTPQSLRVMVRADGQRQPA